MILIYYHNLLINLDNMLREILNTSISIEFHPIYNNQMLNNIMCIITIDTNHSNALKINNIYIVLEKN